MTSKKHFTTEEARQIGKALGIDWSRFDVEQYRMGLDVELEHGLVDPHTNVTNDDPIMTGKIALAHLNEFPDYYTRLEKMEKEADRPMRADPCLHQNGSTGGPGGYALPRPEAYLR